MKLLAFYAAYVLCGFLTYGHVYNNPAPFKSDTPAYRTTLLWPALSGRFIGGRIRLRLPAVLQSR